MTRNIKLKGNGSGANPRCHRRAFDPPIMGRQRRRYAGISGRRKASPIRRRRQVLAGRLLPPGMPAMMSRPMEIIVKPETT
jgi:hypothetical protein